jgi:hypothetical protein
MRAVRVLADNGDSAVAMVEARIDHNALPRFEPVPGNDDAGAVGAENARLRHRGKTAPDPDVEVVQRGGP